MYDAQRNAGHEPPVTSLSVLPPLVLPKVRIESLPLPSSDCWLSDTSVTMFGVKPMNHADLLSVDVPVLPAMGRSSGLTQSSPEPDWTTCCMAYVVSAMTSGAKTCLFAEWCSNATAPWLSVTVRTMKWV